MTAVVAPKLCPATALHPAGSSERTGYPDDAVGRCVRLAGHDGQHVAVLPLASSPGSFSFQWREPSPKCVVP